MRKQTISARERVIVCILIDERRANSKTYCTKEGSRKASADMCLGSHAGLCHMADSVPVRCLTCQSTSEQGHSVSVGEKWRASPKVHRS